MSTGRLHQSPVIHKSPDLNQQAHRPVNRCPIINAPPSQSGAPSLDAPPRATAAPRPSFTVGRRARVPTPHAAPPLYSTSAQNCRKKTNEDPRLSTEKSRGFPFLRNPPTQPSTSSTAAPISAGLSHTRIPAARMASIFPAAVPCPPATIAPACPIRRPGGAVRPAMKPTTGLPK